MSDFTLSPLICSLVGVKQRLSILPRYAGPHFATLERLIYQVMGEYAPDYNGGYWTMWELSNGSFYMAPGLKDESYEMSYAMNQYQGTMTADAAGVVVCLMAFNRMAWKTKEERFIDLFYGLRDWADSHPESAKIFAAID